MSDDVIYTQMVKPAGILRILMCVILLVMAAGAWNATDLTTWVNNMLPYMLWVTPATFIWLLLILMSLCLLQLPFVAHTWLTSQKQSAQISRRIWLVILGTVCAGICAGLGNTLQTENQFIFTISYWSWPGAIWGALLTTTITEWFHLHSKSQYPADTQAKLMELQARIRPHFLFNTLNSAIALVRLDPDAAESVLENLSILFRAALESGDSSAASLEQEANLAKSYLSIEAVRLGERLKTEWALDENTLAAPFPALSLQPIVENAVRHGIEPLPHGGIIRIKSVRSLGKVHLRVANTMPAPDEPQKHPTKGHGMALANLHARISLMHDFEGVLKTKTIKDAYGKYWFVTDLEVPAS